MSAPYWRTRMSALLIVSVQNLADRNVRPPDGSSVDKGKRMSQNAANLAGVSVAANTPGEAPAKPTSFVHHARLISGLTLISRILGVVRESLAARFFGAGIVASAFAVAFTIPNLFRKLFGEWALSAAFIPLYAQSIKHDHADRANEFAAAAVN